MNQLQNKPLSERLAETFCNNNIVKLMSEIPGDMDSTILLYAQKGMDQLVIPVEQTILLSQSPTMLEMLWKRSYTTRFILGLPGGECVPDKEISQFFLSLYQQIHGEGITWEELKSKVEG